MWKYFSVSCQDTPIVDMVFLCNTHNLGAYFSFADEIKVRLKIPLV